MKRLARLILRDELKRNSEFVIGWRNYAKEVTADLQKSQKALEDISLQETPTANATVKRMARIAREALL